MHFQSHNNLSLNTLKKKKKAHYRPNGKGNYRLGKKALLTGRVG